jgi:hypothetical protein
MSGKGQRHEAKQEYEMKQYQGFVNRTTGFHQLGCPRLYGFCLESMSLSSSATLIAIGFWQFTKQKIRIMDVKSFLVDLNLRN